MQKGKLDELDEIDDDNQSRIYFFLLNSIEGSGNYKHSYGNRHASTVTTNNIAYMCLVYQFLTLDTFLHNILINF